MSPHPRLRNSRIAAGFEKALFTVPIIVEVGVLYLWCQVRDQTILQFPVPVIHHEDVVTSLVDPERLFRVVKRVRFPTRPDNARY